LIIINQRKRKRLYTIFLEIVIKTEVYLGLAFTSIAQTILCLIEKIVLWSLDLKSGIIKHLNYNLCLIEKIVSWSLDLKSGIIKHLNYKFLVGIIKIYIDY